MPVLPRHSLFGRQTCCCYTNDAMKWPLDLVSHQNLLLFRETCRLPTLSSVKKMVPQQGVAPRSAGYLPAALLLSYKGMNEA